MSLNNLVKVGIYVIDMGNFEKVSAVRNKYLIDLKPASTSIEIGATTTPGCDVEIDAIAIKKKS